MLARLHDMGMTWVYIYMGMTYAWHGYDLSFFWENHTYFQFCGSLV
jgi:hypothetical protein